MAQSDRYVWLFAHESINHHENAKRCQQSVQSLMTERASIEQSYIQRLHDWARLYKRHMKDKSPYPPAVYEVIILPAHEAAAQADLHQTLYDELVKDEGPCRRMETMLQSLEESKIVSGTNRVYSATVDKFRNMMKELNVFADEVRTIKKDYDKALAEYSKSDMKMEHALNGKPKYTSTPLRLGTLEAKRLGLRNNTDWQHKELHIRYKALETYVRQQRASVNCVLSDLSQFSRHRLSDILVITHAYLKVFLKHQDTTSRDRMRTVLAYCDRKLSDSPVHSFSAGLLQSKIDRIQNAIYAENYFTLEELVGTKQTQSPPARGYSLDTCFLSSVFGVKDNPESPTIGETHHTPVRHNNGLKISNSVIQLLTGSSSQSVQGDDVTPTDDTTMSSQQEETTADNSLVQEKAAKTESIETVILPTEHTEEKLPRSNVPFAVRQFLRNGHEADESPARINCRGNSDGRPIKFTLTAVKEISLMQHKGDALEQEDNGRMPRERVPAEVNNCQITDVHLMTNVRVRAICNYQARNSSELTLEKGQIVKQTWVAGDTKYSYGWTKRHVLSSKQYGHYPADVVELVHSR